MSLGLYALAMISEQERTIVILEEKPTSSKPKRTPPPQIKDPNEGIGISVDYLNQYAMILNGKSKLGIRKQARIKEKVEAYAKRLIEYYELIH